MNFYFINSTASGPRFWFCYFILAILFLCCSGLAAFPRLPDSLCVYALFTPESNRKILCNSFISQLTAFIDSLNQNFLIKHVRTPRFTSRPRQTGKNGEPTLSLRLPQYSYRKYRPHRRPTTYMSPARTCNAQGFKKNANEP